MLYRVYLILFSFFFLQNGATFATPTVHFGPIPAWVVTVKTNDQQPNLRDVNDGYYLKFYEQEINAERDETYQHIVRDIFSDAGVQGASNISINFNPSYEQLTVHQVTVWRDGKPLDKLQKDAFNVVAKEEQLSMFIYNGNYTAYLILKDIRKGDKIEYAYTIIGSNPVFDRKLFTSFTMQGSDPISQVHYYLIAPASRTLNFKYYNNAGKPVVTNVNNSVRYEWNLLDIKGSDATGKAPGWFTPVPYVEVTEYKDWSEVAQWAYRINMPDDKLAGALSKRVGQLQKEYAGDQAALFRAIVDIVQNEVRYMGVEIGPYSHKANSPVKVYDQRYGDCKDKSLLLVSMLRSTGINADVALVNTTDRRKIEDYLPAPSAFNHAIVVAHMGGRDVWVDPTISYQGGTGTDLYCPDYGNALILSPLSKSLVPVPEMPGGEITYSEKYEVQDERKPVSLQVTTTYSLGSADDIRSSFANQGKTDLEKSFLDYYSKTYQHIESADSLVVNDNKSANSLETIERYTIRDFFEFDSSNNNYTVGFYASMLKNQLPVVGNKREYPLAVNYPYNLRYILTVNVPIDWQMKHEKQSIVRNAYSFSYEVSPANGSLVIEYRLSFLKDHIAPGEIAQYEKDYKKIVDDYLSYSFWYKPAGMPANHTGVNYLAIAVFFALLAGCTFAGIRIYKIKTAHNAVGLRVPRELGGWLILPILGLAVSVCRIIYLLFSGGYYNNAMWHAYDGYEKASLFKLLLWSEFIFNGMVVCCSVFCLLLIYKKRDILPKYIIGLYVGTMVFIIVDSACAHMLSPSAQFDSREIIRSIVAVCIWVPYFASSTRVKETFIVPYPNPADVPYDQVSATGEDGHRQEDVVSQSVY